MKYRGLGVIIFPMLQIQDIFVNTDYVILDSVKVLNEFIGNRVRNIIEQTNNKIPFEIMLI